MEVVARRIVAALPTANGEVLVRDRCGRAEVVDSVVAECARRGLDPIVEHVSNAALRELIGSSSPEDLARWDADRMPIADRVSALIVLGGWLMDLDGLPELSVRAWSAAVGRVERALEARHVPTVVVAIPTELVAARLGSSLAAIDALVFPSILSSADEMSVPIGRLVEALAVARTVTVSTAAGTIEFERGDRPIMVDDGIIDEDDIALGAVVSNLPAGSVYWTVIEDATRGAVRISDGAMLDFDRDGRVTFGPYEGERVSHLGVATNPRVGDPIGWTIVDEHRPGAVFLALGENRYMGGENESTINVDLLVDTPTVRIGDVVVVDRGRLIV